MSTITPDLLIELRERGATLTEDAGDLILDAPAGVLTPAILAEVRARKADLLEALRPDFHRSTREADTTAVAPDQYAHMRGITAPIAALAAWLRSLRVPHDPVVAARVDRWGLLRRHLLAPTAAPPYCLDLANCLERIGAGSGNAEDAARIAAWLPTASIGTRAVYVNDRDQGIPMLRELQPLEDVLRAAGVPVVFPPRRTEAELLALYNPLTPAAEPAGA